MMYPAEATDTAIRCTGVFLTRACNELSLDADGAAEFALKARERGKQLPAHEYRNFPFLANRSYDKGEYLYLYRGWYVLITADNVAVTLYDEPRARREKKPHSARVQFQGKKRLRDARLSRQSLCDDDDYLDLL